MNDDANRKRWVPERRNVNVTLTIDRIGDDPLGVLDGVLDQPWMIDGVAVSAEDVRPSRVAQDDGATEPVGR